MRGYQELYEMISGKAQCVFALIQLKNVTVTVVTVFFSKGVPRFLQVSICKQYIITYIYIIYKFLLYNERKRGCEKNCHNRNVTLFASPSVHRETAQRATECLFISHKDSRTTKWYTVVQPKGIQSYNQKMYSRTTKGYTLIRLKGIWSYD